MLPRSLCLALAAFVGTPLAASQVVQIGPFTGAFNESFETQAAQGMSGFQNCVIGRVFQNTADLCSLSQTGAHITGGWSYACQISPQSGTWLFGSTGNQPCEFTFDSPVLRFGGYFGSNTPLAGTMTLDFYDTNQNLIGTDQYAVINDCGWTWRGWESQSAGIARIRITNSDYGGARVMLDGLEADPSAGGGGIGTNYCSPANVNSSGASGAISASGSDVASDANLTLNASMLPTNEFGYFLCSKVTGFIPNVGGGQGNFCLAIPFGRFLSGLQNTGNSGTLQHVVDMANMPNHIPAQVMAGDTWYFQAWYRDTNPGQTSNLTDALEILFQ